MPEDKKNEDKVVLHVHMDCDACRSKVWKAVSGYPGVENINIQMKEQRVTVTGKIDAKKFSEKVQKKSGKETKILYPEQKKDDGKKEEKKKEPADVTVVLKVQVHCEACSKKVKKIASKIKGVYDVSMEGDKLTIKGKGLYPERVCGEVIEKSGRHAEVVPTKKEKEEQKKEEPKKDENKQIPAYTVQYVYPPYYYPPPPGYVYPSSALPPPMFSEENPNTCTLM